MTSAALVLALTAAVLHAFWNLVLARARDVEAATAVTFALSVVFFAPIAALTWDVDRAVWPYALASGALELLYVALLAAAYRRADLSVVYPVARGGAPVLVLLLGVAFVSHATTRAEVAGVALVALGVFLVRGVRNPDRTGLAFGVVIAIVIATYTLVDSRGIRHADPFGYLEVVMAGPALAYLLAIGSIKGRAALRAELGVPVVLAALASFGAYACALAALKLASPAAVAAVRETSVVIAVALAAPVLRERVSRGRLAGAALVVAGVAVLSW